MNTQFSVSILMPAYNCQDFISKAIESCLNQSYKDFELLICDDCSTDNTFDIISRYNKDPRVRIYQNDSNLGYLKTCNMLASKSVGQYITFQDADDWSDLRRIELQLDYLVKNEKHIVGVDCIEVAESGEEKYISFPKTHDNIVRRFSHRGSSSFVYASIMFSRSLYEHVGLYREEFDRIGSEDYDWILRVSSCYELSNISGASYYYRSNPNSVSHQWQSDISNLANITSYICFEVFKNGSSLNELRAMLEQKPEDNPISHYIVLRRIMKKENRTVFVEMFSSMKFLKLKFLFSKELLYLFILNLGKKLSFSKGGDSAFKKKN